MLLSVNDYDNQKELSNRIVSAKYLIVVCPSYSSNIEFLKAGIDLFLETHDNNSDLILPVFMDGVREGMHPVIDEIISKRECPVYIDGKGMYGHQCRRNCIFAILFFVFKIKIKRIFQIV